MLLGIIAAMPQEIELLLQDMEGGSDVDIGGRTYGKGTLYHSEAIVAQCGLGKVSAATTTTTLIDSFRVDAVVLVGLAGAAADEVRIGDIVVASQLVQHDLIEARPFFEQFSVPLHAVTRIEADERLRDAAVHASEKFLQGGLSREIETDALGVFGIKSPKVVVGLVASSDRFVSGLDESNRIRAILPDVKCVEMEGGAVAQVCQEHGVPFAVIRAISDLADHSAEVDFTAFIRLVGRHYVRGVLRSLISTMTEGPQRLSG